MQKLKESNYGVSTLPKKINRKLLDECKVKFLEKNKALVNILRPINNSWFSPILGA